MTWENDIWRGAEIQAPGADSDYEPYGSDPWVAVNEYLELGLQPAVVESQSWPEAVRMLARRPSNKG
jgi:hypothetical protein